MSNHSQSKLLKQLRTELGSGAVLSGADVSARQVGIWDDRPVQALAIVRPESTEQLSGVLRLCHAIGQPVVTHGGRTGLVEGCVSGPGDLVVSFECMTGIESVDEINRCMTVQAGVPLELAQRAANDADLMLSLIHI